jgi:hypothetical protein
MRKQKRNTKVNRNQYTTLAEINQAKKKQFKYLYNAALKQEKYFLAEYCEKMMR